MDASGQPFPPPEEDPLIPPLPDGFPFCRKPCLWIPPPRIGTPKREREGGGSSSEEEMKDPDAKRRTSATDKDGQDMEAPSDAPSPSARDNEGQYGTAPQTQSDMRSCLREIAKNPLRGYPSSIALYGMEPDGTLLNRPVFTTDFA